MDPWYIHYIWGLPFCTSVTGAEFSMIRTPATTLLSSLSLIHCSIHSSFPMPSHWSVSSCSSSLSSHSSSLVSYQFSISQTLHLYYHPSTCPSISYSAPPPLREMRDQRTWPERLVPAGFLLPCSTTISLFVSPSSILTFLIQVKNTRGMRWHEIKKRSGKRVRVERKKKKGPSW